MIDRIPCSNQEKCRLKDSRMGCREDIHHLFFPANQYARGLDKEFREMEDNKVLMCRELHEDIHHTQPIPEHPSRTEMLQALGRIPLEGAA